jgi:transketolase
LTEGWIITPSGPLGQGVATSVGMAIAGWWMTSYFNRPSFDVIDYDVYALCGDASPSTLAVDEQLTQNQEGMFYE